MEKKNSSNTSKGEKPNILKWIGIVSAIIGLIIGISQVSSLYSKWKETGERVESLIKTSRLLSSSGDYEAAWNNLEQALSVKPSSAEVQAEQTTLAMEWLRNIRLYGVKNQTLFSEFTDKLLPVLYNAANRSTGQTKADILAHAGWANYLKYRDGIRNIKVTPYFIEAIAADSLNPYAHAMWGFWMMFPQSEELNIKEGKKQFSIALRSGREAKYVRQLHLSALRNCDFSYENEPEIISAVDEMRKAGDTLSMYERNSILGSAYAFNRSTCDSISAALSPQDHLATFSYLTEGMKLKDRPFLTITHAVLVENTGDYPKALSLYKEIFNDPDLKYMTRRNEVTEAIKRLEGK